MVAVPVFFGSHSYGKQSHEKHKDRRKSDREHDCKDELVGR